MPISENPIDDSVARARLILALRQAGVTDGRVLSVMEQIPRDLFVDDIFKPRAWDDAPLPIQSGQTISQPQIVGLMTAALELKGREIVLEIGTGSGYQTAILSRLCARVFTIERFLGLMKSAEKRLLSLGFTNVVTRHGDGGQGWPNSGPNIGPKFGIGQFDRIIMTCASPSQPDILLNQLAPGGILVAPVGHGTVQELLRYRRRPDGIFEEEQIGDVRFVPLLPGTG